MQEMCFLQSSNKTRYKRGQRRNAAAHGHAARRWEKEYRGCYLDDLPHKRLTRPAKVFEYFFDSMRKGRGRENMLRLEVGSILLHLLKLRSLISHLQ